MFFLMQRIPVLPQGRLFSSQRAVIKTRRAWLITSSVGNCQMLQLWTWLQSGWKPDHLTQQSLFWLVFWVVSPSRKYTWDLPPALSQLFSEPTYKQKKKILTNKHMKQSLTSLTRCEAQIKITLRFTPARKTVFKKRNSSNVRHDERQKNISLHCWWQNKLVWPLWKSGHKFFKKV